MNELPTYQMSGQMTPAYVQCEGAAADPDHVRVTGASDGDIMVYHVPQVTPEGPPPPYPASPPPEAPPPSYDSLYGKALAAKQASSGPAEFLSKFCEMACVAIIGSVAFTVIYGLMLALPIAMIVIGAQYIYQCPVERYIPIYLIVGGASWLIWQLFVWKPCKKKKKVPKDKAAKKAMKAWRKAVKQAKKQSKAEAAEGEGEVTHGGSPVHVVVVTAGLPASKEGEGEGEDTPAENAESSSSKDDEGVSCWETVLLCFIMAWFIAGNVWVYRTAPVWQGKTPLAHDFCDPTLFYFSFWLITGTYILLAAVITVMSAFNICK